jgi:hypothetical protein
MGGGGGGGFGNWFLELVQERGGEGGEGVKGCSVGDEFAAKINAKPFSCSP